MEEQKKETRTNETQEEKRKRERDARLTILPPACREERELSLYDPPFPADR